MANVRQKLARLAGEQGMLIVLLLLCGYYSWATLAVQAPAGEAAAQLIAPRVKALGQGSRILIVVGAGQDDAAFAATAGRIAADAGVAVESTVAGSPADVREVLEKIAAGGGRLDAIVCTAATRAWGLFDDVRAAVPGLPERIAFIQPEPYTWPNFLKRDNLLNIANQIVVIAIIAIGMTMVIITAGIDLSVGSLIALSAVVAALGIQRFGGTGAGAGVMVAACLAGIAVCAAAGLLNGALITAFSVPPFIVTLGMMLIASGTAYRWTAGQSIYDLPETFVWLGRGRMAGLPVAVGFMAILYVLAHVIMAHTTLGRYIYAVGGNPEAARLSGVPVRRVLLLVYALSGALAGLGGIVMASQLRSGAPTYGVMYELYVIAAVVVGGASLSGGEGRVFGTLVGAFIIAVIQNGMNLTGIDSYNQKIVLGAVILGAVLVDKLKRRA